MQSPSSCWSLQGTSALSHCRQDRPRVTKTTLVLDSPLSENSSHLGSQESPGPSGQPKAGTSSPLWAFVPVVSLHPTLPGKALKSIMLALGNGLPSSHPFLSPLPHFCPFPPLLSPYREQLLEDISVCMGWWGELAYSRGLGLPGPQSVRLGGLSPSRLSPWNSLKSGLGPPGPQASDSSFSQEPGTEGGNLDHPPSSLLCLSLEMEFVFMSFGCHRNIMGRGESRTSPFCKKLVSTAFGACRNTHFSNTIRPF